MLRNETLKLRKLGVDPGFGGIKVAEVATEASQADGIQTHWLPSVVGVGSTDSGALNLAGVFRGGLRRNTPHVVGFDGIEYLAGHGVAHHARPIERMDFQRFSDSPELRALLYASLYQLVNGGSHRLALAIGLPVEVLQDRSMAEATEREMSKWLLGEHHFTLDGVPARIEIVALRAKLAQPLATWFDWGLNCAGQWIRGAEGAKAPALIIDPGFNTLDLLVVEQGQISTRYTEGDTLGMRRAAELAATNIDRKYGIERSLHEMDQLVQQIVSGKKASIFVEGRATDVTPQIRQALTSLASDAGRFIERKVGKGKDFKILITGGGALALGAPLKERYPHAEIVAEPVLANARGLAKLAVRKGFLEE